MKYLLPILGLVCLVQALPAQDSLMIKFNQLSQQLYAQPANYLKGNHILSDYEEVFQGTSLESFFFQTAATFNCALGNQKQGKNYYWRSKGIDTNNPLVITDGLIGYRKFFKETANRQVVMVNENHSLPEHRVFTASLLPELFNQGFRYLALEDLLDRDSTINDRIHAYKTDGLYVNEIMYAELERYAREIGFTLVPYDNNDAWDISERDSLGLIELKKIFEKDPKARVVVHCGFGHIDKTQKTLAAFIQSELSINPLTISQVSDRPVIGKAISEPQLFDGSENKIFSIPADFQVVHPDYFISSDRPSYLFENARKKHQINLSAFQLQKEALLEVYHKAYSELTVPIDRILVQPDDVTVDISILSGEHILIFRDANNQIITRKRLSK